MGLAKLLGNNSGALFLRAAALLFFIATEFISFQGLRIAQTYTSVYLASIVFALLWLLLVPALGNKAFIADLREVYFYDVLAQLYGFALAASGYKVDSFLVLANAVFLLKLIRILWPAFSADGTLLACWPRFGLLGVLSRRTPPPGISRRQAAAAYIACIASLPAGFAYHTGVQEGMLALFCLVLLLAVLGTKRITENIETTEAMLRQKSAELAVTEERARVAAERAEQAAELARLNAELAHANQALTDANDHLQINNIALSRANAALVLHEKFVLQANHDIMPLLNFLHAHAEWALEAATSEQQRKSIHEIMALNSKTADRLACLLGIRRAIVHREQSIFTSVRLNAVLEEMELPFMQMAEKRGSQFALKGDFYFNVWSNEEYLQRIISNLVKNAIIHNPPDTQIHVLVTPARKNHCLIRVLDTGRGIPEATGPDREQNFQDLLAHNLHDKPADNQPGSASQGNTSHGIGLQSVATLCEKLGLKIQLYRRGCCGTIFLIRLEMAAKGHEHVD